MAKKENNLHLTELILSIQNEVQSAIDYISEVSQTEGTELGKSSAVMQVETLRVKLPFELSIEQKTGNIPVSVKSNRLSTIKSNLAVRKGFAIDVGEKDKRALLTKIRILSLSKSDTTVPNGNDDQPEKTVMGEIEISFSPLKRE